MGSEDGIPMHMERLLPFMPDGVKPIGPEDISAIMESGAWPGDRERWLHTYLAMVQLEASGSAVVDPEPEDPMPLPPNAVVYDPKWKLKVGKASEAEG